MNILQIVERYLEVLNLFARKMNEYGSMKIVWTSGGGGGWVYSDPNCMDIFHGIWVDENVQPGSTGRLFVVAICCFGS
jgi:hypothetical protein